ncbi:unnamed protein product [Heligmosomoides polygyrus]|uniref:Uncharacterized protein n=1 Tax=Heligmosomoides polygyrus TaxID=6339 RepID=A0A183FMQ6_HELPZ|nr:unnamed protein product [Heligmosomoides polygyrus]
MQCRGSPATRLEKDGRSLEPDDGNELLIELRWRLLRPIAPRCSGCIPAHSSARQTSDEQRMPQPTEVVWMLIIETYT